MPWRRIGPNDTRADIGTPCISLFPTVRTRSGPTRYNRIATRSSVVHTRSVAVVPGS